MYPAYRLRYIERGDGWKVPLFCVSDDDERTKMYVPAEYIRNRAPPETNYDRIEKDLNRGVYK